MLPAPRSSFNYGTVDSDLEQELRAHASTIRQAVKTTVLSAIEAGKSLLAVKYKLLEHGQFSAWVAAECGFSLRSGENFIAVARFAEGVKSETISLLPPAAVYKLAAKNTPPALVKEVIRRVEGGSRVTSAEIDFALGEVKRKKRDADRAAARSAARQKKTKDALVREEARRRAEEERQRQEQERLRALALLLIDKIGEDHAEIVVEILCGSDGWEVAHYLRQKMVERETARIKQNATLQRPDLKVVQPSTQSTRG